MLDHRYTVVMISDVKRGNPNGDPDTGNKPRIDIETGNGIISNHSLKRKMRDTLKILYPEVEIYVERGTNLSAVQKNLAKELGVSPSKAESKPVLIKGMQEKFIDVRLFGAVLTQVATQIVGPVQVTDAESCDRIAIENLALTCVAGSGEKKGEARDRNMGSRWLVPYGLYVAHIDITPTAMRGSECNEEDIEKLFVAIQKMFDLHQTSTSGEQTLRKLIVFEHENKLGDQPKTELYDAVKIKKLCPGAPQSFADYEISIDRNAISDKVTIRELV